MGEQQVLEPADEAAALRDFTRRLLADLRALERMLREGLLETGKRRMGAEQEAFLVDARMRPAPVVLELLKRLADPHFVTEVAKFNLEFNLDPLPLTGDCFSRLEAQGTELLAKARAAAATLECDVLLAGILPTVSKADLTLDNMTPVPRYFAINRALRRLRGSDYEIRLKGVDELSIRHDSVMVEACNASFQVHLQVDPADFAAIYNVAQVVAGPVLAAATNSPMLFGRRLWKETRIALFQQSVDTRGGEDLGREIPPRVDFGRGWVDRSILELYREGVSRHRVLIASDLDEDPFVVLDRGGVPGLGALRLHNGTIYRWNRPCYGILDGKPHLRIEARMLPSGPTVLDEVANAALWYGLMAAVPGICPDVRKAMSFSDAKGNFFAAARLGLASSLTWLDGDPKPAPILLLDTLLPLAATGLRALDVDRKDAARYLGVVEERVRNQCTGARWLLKSYNDMGTRGTEAERLNAVTAATLARQRLGEPVARWPFARLEEGGGWRSNYTRVEQFMSRDFVTVHEDDPLELVANLVLWERVRHVPVEDADRRIVGLVSYRGVLRALLEHQQRGSSAQVSVADIMKRDPWTVAPETSTLDAVELMRRTEVGCLPVVRDGRLVGMVIPRDLMWVAAGLLEQRMRDT